MRNYKTYEWDIEEIEGIDEDADIIDHTHEFELECFYYGTLVEALKPDTKYRLVLVINIGNEVEGLSDRAWAYVGADHKLPENFMDAWDHATRWPVPKRFHAELARKVKGLGDALAA